MRWGSKEHEYVEGTAAGRWRLLAIGLAFVVLALALRVHAAAFPIDGSLEERILQVGDRLWYARLILVVINVAMMAAILAIAMRVARDMRWPPLDFPVPFRTRILRVRHSSHVWLYVAFLIACDLAAMAAATSRWRAEDQDIHFLLQDVRLIEEFTKQEVPSPGQGGI